MISLNPCFKNIIENYRAGEVNVSSDAAESTNELILKTALEKRKEIAKLFIDAKTKDETTVNPLMLIQLPDRRQGTDDVQVEIEQILKEKHKISTENGKLAIYLSENKSNLENITRNDSEVEVMIFKQAIALGWDCPRACILVLFRDWKSITFSIQTIGRILRMPELKHYENEEMNTGFVFTNLNDISIQEDIAGSYLTVYSSKRKNVYKNITLNSVHSKRFREETRLSPIFITDFLSASKELNLSQNINIEIDEIKAQLISDGIITNPDRTFNHISGQTSFLEEHSAETVEIIQTEKEIQNKFDLFVRECLKPLAPEKRSVGRIKDSIYRFLRNSFPTKFEYGGVNGQMVVLNPRNSQLFIDTINRAKEIYQKNVGQGKKEIIPDEKWEVPILVNFDNNCIQRSANKCIMDPFLESTSASGPEKLFVDFLESKTNEIDWWFKNGIGVGKYFAVPYNENEEDEVFYVDWIVHYTNGKIGLFDTKAGITAQTAKAKAEGLAKYIKEQNSNGKNLFGGIVVYKEGSWRYNDHTKYEFNPNDLSAWKFL
jgi:type III restriction enzyme